MNKVTEQKYLRMSLNERIQHFVLLISFFTLAVTGFTLKFPDAFWSAWLRKLLGENAFELRGDIHRIAAVLMVGISVYHLFYIIFNERGKKLLRDLLPAKKDFTDFKEAFKYYFGKSKEKPKLGRFSYIEKMEYWAVFWGTFIMGVTGVALWFENIFLPLISNTGMDIATAIHYYEAILATLAILVWHFYFVIYNPDVYPMNKAWLTGYLTREEMEKEHPLELEEIEKELQEGTAGKIVKEAADKKETADSEKSVQENSNFSENRDSIITSSKTGNSYKSFLKL